MDTNQWPSADTSKSAGEGLDEASVEEAATFFLDLFTRDKDY